MTSLVEVSAVYGRNGTSESYSDDEAMERIDDLQNGLKIIQDTNLFMFGTDSVLLSKFVRVKKGARVLDIGTGTGVLCFLLYGKQQEAEYTGIELQEKSFELAQKSKALNGIKSGVEFINTDLKEYTDKNGFDIVVCNPPYERLGTGFMGGNDHVLKSRYEITATLEDIICCAARNLRSCGRLFMIYKAERIGELTVCLREFGLELKELQPIFGGDKKVPRLLLISATKDGQSGVKWYEPLVVG